ncbi:hypothetical protein AURDEDRAFT_117120 [Auricularia subglabra TFB-10046 SS5]|uniref:F-box domain-containing protein n=1 Tax=Auricularia subglabra (strain TFB-10046 / SS5) TaxID=717982 RepID=J0WU32_AURST|nr:hypothetical protein AURDEDRAFT_117120 [Auricularia subglabra TFB-10046 SS5]
MSARHLPPELLLEVFGAGLGSADLARVCCACQHFRDIAEPILYTTVSLASTVQLRSFIGALRARPGRGDLARALKVDWSKSLLEGTGLPETPFLGFWRFHTRSAFADDGPDGGELSVLDGIDQEAKARGMAHGLRRGIQEQIAPALVVLLLDMLPNLRSLHVVPSTVEFWFWAAFPNPCHPDAPKRIPQGLQSLESLDVHYGSDNDDFASLLNNGVGFAHIKLIVALLLPNLRRLSFSGDDGDDEVWENRYSEDWDDDNSHLDMARLAGRSGVTDLKLRGTEMLPEVLMPILDMLRAPERVHLEQEDEADFAPFDAFLARPTLRSFALVEYPGDYLQREEDWEPLATLRTRDHLTHLALPVRALARDGEDLARSVPRGVEHLDLAYASAAELRDDADRLVKLVHALAEPGRRVQRLTVRPAVRDLHSGRVRAACAASGIAFYEEPWIEAPDMRVDPYGDSEYDDSDDMYEDEYDPDYDDFDAYGDVYMDDIDAFGEDDDDDDDDMDEDEDEDETDEDDG